MKKIKIFLSAFFVVVFFTNVFAQVPSITSFTPASGVAGTAVTITGTNFSTTAANNVVLFGGVRAQIIGTPSATSITVKVPKGASYAPITVSIGLLTAYSKQLFVLTNACPAPITFASYDTSSVALTSTANPNPYYTALADFDGDSLNDLAVLLEAEDKIEFRRNTSTIGSISFSISQTLGTGNAPKSIGIGDLNGDGKMDVVTTNITGNAYFYRNTSTGVGVVTFANPVSKEFSTTTNLDNVGCTIGDIDGDGKPDFITTTAQADSVSIIRNTHGAVGTAFGAVTSFANAVKFLVTGKPTHVYLSDIDEDGKVDLVTSNGVSDSVSVLRNTSTVGSVNFDAPVSFSTQDAPYDHCIGDIDGDGKPDIVVPNNLSSTFSVLRNTSSSGNVSFDTRVNFATGTATRITRLTDLNGDGKLDVLVAGAGVPDEILYFENISATGTIAFNTAVSFPLQSSFDIRNISVADMNGDSRPDIVGVSQSKDRIAYLRNNIFGGPKMTSVSSKTICSGTSVALTLLANPSSGTTYTWIASDNPNVTGESLSTQTTSVITNTLVNISSTVQTVTYTVTPTSSTTCSGGTPQPQIVTISVNPKPDPNNVSRNACSGESFSFTPSAGTVPVGTLFSWSAPTVNGGMTGASSGSNVSAISGALTNTTTTSQTATYTISTSYAGCAGNSFTLTLTVNPKPVMSSATSTSVCSGTALNFALTSVVPSTYSWLTTDNTNTSGESTTAVTGATINNTITNNITTATSLVYTVTPTSTTGNCVGNPQNVTITVNPLPIMTSATSKAICSGTAVNLTLTSGAAASYSWLTTNNTNTTGESTTAQVFSSITNTITSTATTATTLIYTVTPTGTAGSCVGAAQTVTVTVNPKPVMSSANTTSTCSGSTMNFALTSAVSSTYSWNTTASSTISGESTGLQTRAVIDNTLTNTSLTAPTTLIYTVTPTGTAGGCVGAAQTVTVTLNPTPVMNSASSTSICSETAVNFTLTSSTPSTFSWIAVNNGNTTGESFTTQTGAQITDVITNITTVPRQVNYSITPTGTAGSCVGAVQTVSVTVNPKPIMTSATTYSVCSGVAMNLVLTSGASSTYSWLTSDNINTTGESVLQQSGNTINNTINHTLSSAQTLTYTVTPTGTAGACVGNAQTVTVTVNPKATMTSAATKTICSGSPVALALTSNLTSTYQWIAASNANVGGESTTTVTSTAISNILTNTLTAAQVVTYTVTPTTSLGCVSNIQTVTITIDPQPTTAAAGTDQTACTSTALLNGNLPTVGTGVWSQVSGPAASITNANLYNTTISALINSNTVVMQWTISNGVCASSTDQVSVTYNTAAVECLINSDFYADNSDPCINAPVIFTDNSLGASTYSWNFGPGATPPTANTAGPHSVTYSTAGAKTVSLFITGTNGSDTETKSAYINVVPAPSAAGAISGTFTLCAGSNQVLYSVSPISNATSYNWTLPSGATINTGAGTNSISVNFANNATSGTISVVGVNACGSGTISSSSITVNPLPANPSVISGSSVVCQTLGSTAITYSIAPIAGATSYNWTYPTGTTPTITSNTLTLVYGTSAVSGDVTVYGSNVACGNSLTTSTLSVVVNPLPSAAGSINGPATVCQGASDNYSIDAILNATSYTWTLPSGGSTSSNSNSALVNFSTSASNGNIIVAGTNSCGNGPSNSLALTLDLLPFAPGSITGPSTVCANSTGHVYSIPSIANANSYNWVFPNGANSVNPNNIANAYFDTNASSGLISVSGVNACGAGTSNTFSVTVSPLPDAAGVLTGPDTVCQGQTAVMYSINPVNNATNYVWFTPNGSSGAGTNNFSVDYSTSATSGNITVYGNNACGNGDSTTMPIHLNPLPSPPVFSGNTMLASCPLADSMLFNFSTALYAESFNWILPAGAYANGATNNDSINIGFTSVGVNDTLKVASINGCGNSAYSYMVLNLQSLVTPEICMVTVDDSSRFNHVYWNKSGYSPGDTFIVYREVTNNNYQIIGRVAYDSLSMFVDTVRTQYFPNTGDPNVSSNRYKLAVQDSCGNTSDMSLYHQTIFVQDQLNGNFNWNDYQIEGQPVPIIQLTDYVLIRDNDADGIFESTVGSTSSNLISDPQYFIYQYVADWKVETNWTIICEPTLRIGINNVNQTAIVRSKSNIKNQRVIGIKDDKSLNTKLKVYPNPATDFITIELEGLNKESVITIENMLGQVVFKLQTNNTTNLINTNGLINGVYFVKYQAGSHLNSVKLVIQK